MCPFLKDNKDGGTWSYNTYTCKRTGKKMDYKSFEVQNWCMKCKENCPEYKKA